MTMRRGSREDMALNRWCWRRAAGKLEKKHRGRLPSHWRQTDMGYRAFQDCKRELVAMDPEDRAIILSVMLEAEEHPERYGRKK
jgi:hypothetical protein